MRIGFPFDENGKGGVRTWVKTFSQYCKEKGHDVFFSPSADVDVFIVIANTSKIADVERLKAKGTKIIHRMDGIFFNYFAYQNQTNDKANEELITFMKYADLVIYQSHYSKALANYILKGEEVPGTIIYNGIDTKLFSPVGPIVPRDLNKKLILSVAYWGTPKMAEFSVNTILGAADALKGLDYEFWILGDAHPSIEEMIKEAHLPNVTEVNLTKPIPHNKMGDYLRTADLVLHTRPHDACSNLILEAMNVNKPIVGLNSGSTPELLADCGLTAKCTGTVEELPKVDCKHLASQIEATFNNYEFYKQKITERSKIFNKEYMSEAYLKVIENLVGGR